MLTCLLAFDVVYQQGVAERRRERRQRPAPLQTHSGLANQLALLIKMIF